MDYSDLIAKLQKIADLKKKYKGTGEPEQSYVSAITGLLVENRFLRNAAKERDAAVKDLETMARTIRSQKVNDDACCFACEHNCPVEDYCPGWDEEDCFEWRGKEVCKG